MKRKKQGTGVGSPLTEHLLIAPNLDTASDGHASAGPRAETRNNPLANAILGSTLTERLVIADNPIATTEPESSPTQGSHEDAQQTDDSADNGPRTFDLSGMEIAVDGGAQHPSPSRATGAAPVSAVRTHGDRVFAQSITSDSCTALSPEPLADSDTFANPHVKGVNVRMGISLGEPHDIGLSGLELSTGMLRADGCAAAPDLEVDERPRDFVFLCEDGEGALLPRGMKKRANVSSVRSLPELCTAVRRALSLQAELHVTIFDEDFAAWVIPSKLSEVPAKGHIRITPVLDDSEFVDSKPHAHEHNSLVQHSSVELQLNNMGASESLTEFNSDSSGADRDLEEFGGREPYTKGSRGYHRFRELPGNVKVWCIACIIGTALF